MAYVAVTGGEKAIESSLEQLANIREQGNISPATILSSLSMLVDEVMSEASLYSPEYAALALKQASGSKEEAVFILRAYRSTLQRDYYSREINTESMKLIRRISSSYKDIPGGQILGPTYDYSHRLLDFDLLKDVSNDQANDGIHPLGPTTIQASHVADTLRKEGLLPEREIDPSEPEDVTRMKLQFPASRSARLQSLTRLETGFLSGVAYSAMRGYGGAHPTIAELRCGYVEIEIDYPFNPEESLVIGEVLLTEVEALTGSLDSNRETMATMDSGYGLIMGRGETKAIAMAIVDASLNTEGEGPAQDQEFVLTHGDCLEMNGFIAHLKLPHYVTFQSKLDRSRTIVKERKEGKNND